MVMVGFVPILTYPPKEETPLYSFCIGFCQIFIGGVSMKSLCKFSSDASWKITSPFTLSLVKQFRQPIHDVDRLFSNTPYLVFFFVSHFWNR